MGSKSYTKSEKFILYPDKGLHDDDVKGFFLLLDDLYGSYQDQDIDSSSRDILDFKLINLGFDTTLRQHPIELEYKKVISSKSNQVCFLGLLLDLETGNFLISDRKKDTYFSLFNIFKLLESYGIFITPEVLKYNIEQYKFNQITFVELYENFKESSEGVKSITSRYLSTDYLSKDIDGEWGEVPVQHFIREIMSLIKVLSLVSRDVFPSLSSDSVEGEPSDDVKLFFSDLRHATDGVKKISNLLSDLSTFSDFRQVDEIEDFLSLLTSGAHLYIYEDFYRGDDLTPKKIQYALNLKDVLENDPETSLYLDEMFMGDIDSKELVDRIGLRDYVRGRFAGYSAQGFVHGKYEELMKSYSYSSGVPIGKGISPEGEGDFTTQQRIYKGVESSVMGYVNASFRKLQRALRRMEQVT